MTYSVLSEKMVIVRNLQYRNLEIAGAFHLSPYQCIDFRCELKKKSSIPTILQLKKGNKWYAQNRFKLLFVTLS